MYQVIILDLDNTIVDFDKMELASLRACLKKHHLPYDDHKIEGYIAINKHLWEGLEKGEYKKKEILTLRFKKWLNQFDLLGDPDQLNQCFLDGMADHIHFMPGARALLDHIKDDYKVVMMTNGVYAAAQKKIDKSGIRDYFDCIIISDEIGFHKPQLEMFEYMEKRIGVHEKDKVIIIGDSLTSDIKGGNNYGIHTCWYNPKKLVNHIQRTTYEITNLRELLDIL